MEGLTANRLVFKVRTKSSIQFGSQPGSALRGALYSTMVDLFCDPHAPDELPHPVKRFLALEDASHSRGENIPRSFTVEPPLKHTFDAEQVMRFSFTLIGDGRDMLPYVVRSVAEMGKRGVGQGRGKFDLLSVGERCPLLDAERDLMTGSLVKQPRLTVTSARVMDAVDSLMPDRITLRFHTPTRLISDGSLQKNFDVVVFIKRVLERCQALATYYVVDPPEREMWLALYQELIPIAEQVKILDDRTHWQEAQSGSKRQNRWTPISGFVGDVTLVGELQPLVKWILWGAVVHVGKNAVKGNGWYDVLS